VSARCRTEVIPDTGDRTTADRHDALASRGIEILHRPVTRHRPARSPSPKGGTTLNYDALVVAPERRLNYGAIGRGYSEAGPRIPHATRRRADPDPEKQLERSDGAALVRNPVRRPRSRCPPGPYELRPQSSHYCKPRHRPRAKVAHPRTRTTPSPRRRVSSRLGGPYYAAIDFRCPLRRRQGREDRPEAHGRHRARDQIRGRS